MNAETNGATNGEKQVPLPSAKPFDVSRNVVVQPPLTRRGHGPGLLLLVPAGLDLNGSSKTLDPSPLQKWAEEGFAVAQITLADGEGQKFQGHLKEAIDGLSKQSECDSTDRMGLICKVAPSPSELQYTDYLLSVQCARHTGCFERRGLD